MECIVALDQHKKKETNGTLMLQKLLQNAGLVQFQHHKEPSKSLPKPKCCELKVGAQVLLSFNLDVPGGLVNGSRGVVIGFSKTNSERKKEGEFLKNSDSEERFSMQELPMWLYPE